MYLCFNGARIYTPKWGKEYKLWRNFWGQWMQIMNVMWRMRKVFKLVFKLPCEGWKCLTGVERGCHMKKLIMERGKFWMFWPYGQFLMCFMFYIIFQTWQCICRKCSDEAISVINKQIPTLLIMEHSVPLWNWVNHMCLTS